ncbi:NAD(P)/FAD-dependent oxidoreductase [Enterococcus sp. JM9B]|uniref:NAD(P)/FAD-dependent oxidoreductase n=1 Tax=Enterococcus sp. JM9B TaxID=1857216 RepID=UPI001374E475|nr:FAD-dependent oxidoreductase [Enterococcus sp. JM9B]KAF1303966.1 oxidoreductase [Enterococcus sp. JM9B]
MKKIAIIGGGIIGLTLANYLDTNKFSITLFDEPTGQATGASAGIISPWLSKRRNKKWYRLAQDGAAFFPKLIADMQLDEKIYQQTGTLLLRDTAELETVAQLAEERKAGAPEIGDIQLLTAAETQASLPLLNKIPSLKISGGGKLDGKAYLQHLTRRAKAKNITIISATANLRQTETGWQVLTDQPLDFDLVALTPGPRLKQLLAPLGFHVDLRPQKGQLVVFETNFKESGNWPVAMLDGEADLIPFIDGTILLGATHENDAGWDLQPTNEAYLQLTENSRHFFHAPDELFSHFKKIQVGTRAYTADFAPFFGPLETAPSLAVASGLGSSGLTTGPYIGYLLAEYFNTGQLQTTPYEKSLDTYIQ